MSGAGPRVAAVNALAAVIDHGRSLTQALPECQRPLSTAADRALCQTLVYGSLRQYRRLDLLASRLLSRPLKRRDRDMHFALIVGLHQLDGMALAEHAAVAATVEVARELRKPWAVRLLNATLRRFQRERASLAASVDAQCGAAVGLPEWLYGQLRVDWPDAVDDIARASARQAPMTLRVNTRRGSRDDYIAELVAAGLKASPVMDVEAAVMLETPVAVERLPGFAEGRVSVQDAAAQLAAGLVLAGGESDRILDACAAPGGKTAHLLELRPQASVTAVEVDTSRAERLRASVSRLGLSASVVVADACRPEQWWDGRSFDAILVDAPCSGTGVIRRHPDIAWLRRVTDIPRLSAVQRDLLAALWPLLAPGGRLVYATCSVLRAENDQVIAEHRRRHADAVAIRPRLPVGRRAGDGIQITPGERDMDGFFYSCLHKR